MPLFLFFFSHTDNAFRQARAYFIVLGKYLRGWQRANVNTALYKHLSSLATLI